MQGLGHALSLHQYFFGERTEYSRSINMSKQYYAMRSLNGESLFQGTCTSEDGTRQKHRVENINASVGQMTTTVIEELPGKKPMSECFEGISKGTFTGIGFPRNTVIAVGPNHIVQTSFLLVNIYNKEGELLSSFPSSLVFGAYRNSFVHYDPYGDKFYLYKILPQQTLLIAVSRTSNPLDGFDAYSFKFSEDGYYLPGSLMGSWHNGLYISFRAVGDNQDGVIINSVTKLVVIDRNSFATTPALLYANFPWDIDGSDPVYHDPMAPNATATSPPHCRNGCFIGIPIIVKLGSQPGFFNIDYPPFLTAFETKVSFHKGRGMVRVFNTAEIKDYIPFYVYEMSAAQKGTDKYVFCGVDKPVHAQYSNVCGAERYWIHSYSMTGDALFIVMFELKVSDGELLVVSRYNSQPGKDKEVGRFDPGIAVNKLGDVVMSYFKSNKDIYLSTFLVSRFVDDKEGLLSQEHLLVEGEGYTTDEVVISNVSATVDTDGRTFYICSQYQKPGEDNWTTKICKVRV